jgi:hypothetical protein
MGEGLTERLTEREALQEVVIMLRTLEHARIFVRGGHPLHKGRTTKKTYIPVWPTASKLLTLAVSDCFRRN